MERLNETGELRQMLKTYKVNIIHNDAIHRIQFQILILKKKILKIPVNRFVIHMSHMWWISSIAMSKLQGIQKVGTS